MADKKISQLTNLTGANLADNDEFVLVDTSADETKAITWSELKEGLDTGTGFVRITGDTMTGDLTVPNLITSGDVDGRDVSADGTKLDGIEANADVTDTANVTSAGALMTTGGTLTGDVSFDGGDTIYGDNDKAIFGAGSDLQIYHDGSASYIDDAGTGNLFVRGNNLALKNADGSKSYFFGTNGGAANVYYDGASKLATTSTGIDVTGAVIADSANITGTVTADGLTFNAEGDTITFQTSGTPDGRITTGDDIKANSLQLEADNAVVINSGQDDGGASEVDGTFISRGSTFTKTALFDVNGDISFYEDTGTTPKFFWDASTERLGIGNSSPATALDVTGTVTADGLTVDGKAEVNGVGSTTGIQLDNGAQAHKWYLVDNFTNRWDIGTSSLGAIYNFGSNSGARNHLQITTGGDISFYEDTGTTPKFFWDASAESLGIGTSSPATHGLVDGLVIGDGTSNQGITLFGSTTSQQNIAFTDIAGDQRGLLQYNHSSDAMRFFTSATERMRIDSSGNLLVGTPDAAVGVGNTNTGHSLGAAGYAAISRTGTSAQATMYLNKNTNDGAIIDFRKDGSTVGSIGTFNDYMTVGSGDTGLLMYNGGDVIRPHNMSTNTARDNAIDFGSASDRFKDLYLSGGVYLGGTGAANKLDEYEEGTFTLEVADAGSGGNVSSSTGTGYYTKVGNQVTVHAGVGNIDTSGMTSANPLSLRGLPFTSSLSGVNANGTIKVDSVNFQASNAYCIVELGHNSTAALIKQVQDNGVDTNTTVGDLTSGVSDILFSLTYRTT